MAQATFKRGNYIPVTLPNNSGSTITAGDLVADDGSNGITALTDGVGLLGVAHDTILTGASGVVWIPSGNSVWEIDLATGFNPAQLDPIYAAGSGTFDDGSATNPNCGFIVDTNPASGSATARAVLVSVKLNPALHA